MEHTPCHTMKPITTILHEMKILFVRDTATNYTHRTTTHFSRLIWHSAIGAVNPPTAQPITGLYIVLVN